MQLQPGFSVRMVLPKWLDWVVTVSRSALSHMAIIMLLLNNL